jgi:sec-independent protein translocase protein TatA
MFGIGSTEMIVFGIIAVILFGGRLPSVARSLGKSIVEFKKGMKDIEDDLKTSIYSEPDKRIGYDDHNEPNSPRFEPPKAEQSSEREPVASETSGQA